MRKINREKLIKKAQSIAGVKKLSEECKSGDCGCALVTDKGNVFIGVSIDCACGIGFCAETNAIGNMVTSGESRIKIIVAVTKKGKILPPCGRCRELMLQVNDGNLNTEIIVGKNKVVKLKDLLPDPWQKRF